MAKGKYAKWLEEHNLILLEGWARDGLSDVDIAHNMGINPATLYTWKAKYSEIDKALKKGKEVADYIVENALFKSALGYDVTEYEDKLDQLGNVVNTKKVRHIPASVTAQIYWLKNRKPAQWRDKPAEQNESDRAKLDELIAAIKGVD